MWEHGGNRPDSQSLAQLTSWASQILGALLFGGLALKKNPLKAILGGSFNLTDRAWTVLAVRYGLFWWACAVANEVIRRTQTAETWAVFRVVVLVAAAAFASTFYVNGLVGRDFIPADDQGEFQAIFDSPVDSSLDATAAYAAELRRLRDAGVLIHDRGRLTKRVRFDKPLELIAE